MPLALQAGRCWIGDEGPVHSEGSFEALEVLQIEPVPVGGCVDLGLPFGTEFGDLGNDCGVFDHVGELAALGEGTKAVEVLTGSGEVMGIHGEVGVHRGVVANPRKGLKPRVI